MPRCLIVSTSCYAAEPSLPHIMFLGVPCAMLCCLILPSRRYAAWSFIPHATFLTFLCYVACVLYIISIYFVEFFVWSSCCYAAWPSLPLVRLLGLPYPMWCCLMCSVSYCAIRSCPHDATLHDSLRQTTLLDLLCCLMLLHQSVLRCLVLSSWCYAAWSSLHHALLHSEWISLAKVLAPKTILGAQVFRVWHQQRH